MNRQFILEKQAESSRREYKHRFSTRRHDSNTDDNLHNKLGWEMALIIMQILCVLSDVPDWVKQCEIQKPRPFEHFAR